MDKKNLNNLCDVCENEFSQGQSYSFVKVHEWCRKKTEPKVYHHQNRNEVTIGKFYEPWVGARWAAPTKLFKITGDIQSPFVIEHISDGKKIHSLFTIIRECEQPEEKVREVTIEEVKKAFIMRG